MRHSLIELGFIKYFLYGLILELILIFVKRFTNFLTNFMERRGNMSQQHQKWIDLVKKRLHERGWSQADFAIVLGVSPAMVTRLLKEGHGSDSLKIKVNKKLRISESWESFEEE